MQVLLNMTESQKQLHDRHNHIRLEHRQGYATNRFKVTGLSMNIRGLADEYLRTVMQKLRILDLLIEIKGQESHRITVEMHI